MKGDKILIKHLLVGVVELSFFAGGLMFLIPPVPSDPSTKVHFVPQGIMACTLFFIGQVIALWRGKETLLMILAKMVGFIFFALLLYQRFQY